jgi:hypothetical protein
MYRFKKFIGLLAVITIFCCCLPLGPIGWICGYFICNLILTALTDE